MKHFKDLTEKRWFTFSFNEQMGNTGSEICRTITRRKENKELSKRFFEMGLELFDAIIADPKNQDKKDELLKVKKELIGYFSSDTFSESGDKKWNDYFYMFAWSAALEREKRYPKV